jgi:hypothetical protein
VETLLDVSVPILVHGTNATEVGGEVDVVGGAAGAGAGAAGGEGAAAGAGAKGAGGE